MFEILAKRLDVFQCVAFSIPCISVILDSKLRQVADLHCGRGAAYYTLEMPHVLLTLQGTKENLEARKLERKLGKASISNRLVEKSF